MPPTVPNSVRRYSFPSLGCPVNSSKYRYLFLWQTGNVSVDTVFDLDASEATLNAGNNALVERLEDTRCVLGEELKFHVKERSGGLHVRAHVVHEQQDVALLQHHAQVQT